MDFSFQAMQLNTEFVKVKDFLMTYVKVLLDYNVNVNLISRKITPEGLGALLNETLIVQENLSFDFVVDAGSGNGILGIPTAILNESKKIVLVEPRQKKAQFLIHAVNLLGLKNVEVKGISIEEYLKSTSRKNLSLIARGFPELSVFSLYLKKYWISEAVIITSENKIKNNSKDLESLSKRIYNVPLRNELKILKIWRT